MTQTREPGIVSPSPGTGIVPARVEPASQLLFVGLLLGASLVVGVGAAQGILPGAAALVVALLAVVVLRRPAIGALLLIALVPVTSGLSRGLPIPQLKLSEALAVTLGGSLLLLASSERRVRWTPFDRAALAYVIATAALGAFDLLVRGERFSREELGVLAGPLQFFLLYRALVVTVTSARLRRLGLATLLAASVPVSLLSLLQVFDLGGVRELLSTATATQGEVDLGFAHSIEVGGPGRATGPFPSWHALGGYLLIVVLLGVALLWESSRPTAGRAWLLVVLALAATALMATVSFAPIAGAVAGIVVLGLWLGRARQAVVSLAVAGLVLALVFGPSLAGRLDDQLASVPAAQRQGLLLPTLNARVEIWTEQYLPVLEGRWATGWGPDRPPAPQVVWPSTESIYVEMLIRGGLVLLAAYLALMWTLGAAAWRLASDPDAARRAASRALFVAVVVLALIQTIIPLFIGAGMPHALWVLAALVLAPDTRGSDPLSHGSPYRHRLL